MHSDFNIIDISSLANAFTVFVFGTVTMFLYPFLYKAGLIPLISEHMGIYIGGKINEVAHEIL